MILEKYTVCSINQHLFSVYLYCMIVRIVASGHRGSPASQLVLWNRLPVVIIILLCKYELQLAK